MGAIFQTSAMETRKIDLKEANLNMRCPTTCTDVEATLKHVGGNTGWQWHNSGVGRVSTHSSGKQQGAMLC